MSTPAVIDFIEQGERVLVFDLSVEPRHNYFANGILVHNKLPCPCPESTGTCHDCQTNDVPLLNRCALLAEPFDVSLPAISKQLGVLEKAGLLVREKDGRVRRCRLDAGPMREAAQWIGRYRGFWEARLDSLADYLDEIPTEDGPNDATDA